MKILAFLFFLIWAGPALAQQQVADPATLQRLLTMTQAQRNQLFDAFTAASVQIEALTDDLAKARARLNELEQKPEPEK